MEGQGFPLFQLNLAKSYSENFKRMVVREFEKGSLNKKELGRKYGIPGHATILKWCRKYGRHTPQRGTRNTEMRMDKKETELLLLQNEIKALKQELEDARFKNVVWETLVDVAERELKIPIRKKYGAKRSGK